MKYIQINPLDNVAVALTDLKAGERVGDVVLRTDLSRGHKVLLKDLKEGEDVIKYGSPIGHVTRDIPAGTPVDHSCIPGIRFRRISRRQGSAAPSAASSGRTARWACATRSGSFPRWDA